MEINRLFRLAFAGATTLACTLLLGLSASAQVAITINGQEVDVAPPPLISAGRVFVPLRGVFENLGASVVYSNGQINATGNGRDISLQIGSTQATVDGSPVTIDVAPFIVGASTFVPLRFVSEALGASVDWDDTNRIVAITLAGAPQNEQSDQGVPSYAQADEYVTQAPPPIPDYELPPVPDPNYIWMPGYWAWGDAGYFWVPGTWVAAPEVGFLWTPGYWGFSNGYFGWHPGYWAQNIGFYGGVNYGGGYYGHGYAGGRWSDNQFSYNTAIVHVINTTIITNVYVDRTVVIDNARAKRTGYNGGPGGIAARPTAPELLVAKAHHLAMTPVQVQHVRIAGQDRRLLKSVNAGAPPIVVAPHPYSAALKPAGIIPIKAQDKAAAEKLVVRPAGVRPGLAPVAKPAAIPETVRPVIPETVHTPEPVRTAEPVRAPPERPAPVPSPVPVRAPLERPAPVIHLTPRPPLVTPVPAVIHPIIVHSTPVRPLVVRTPLPRPPVIRTPLPRPPVVRTEAPRPRPTETP